MPLANIVKESRFSAQAKPGSNFPEQLKIVANAAAAVVVKRVLHDELPGRLGVGHPHVEVSSDGWRALAYFAVHCHQLEMTLFIRSDLGESDRFSQLTPWPFNQAAAVNTRENPALSYGGLALWALSFSP